MDIHGVLASALLAATGVAPASGGDVVRWHVPGVSSAAWESHPAIDPRTHDLWFVRSDSDFSGWQLMWSRCLPQGWSAPAPAPIAANEGIEADPWFSVDGKALYFISSRASGSRESAGLDIWFASRDAQGDWGTPTRLPEPVNSPHAEWFPRPDADGWLYFGSRRPGGFGKDDIWRARRNATGRWQVENAGSAINSAGAEYEFQPAASGRWALLATDDGLFRVERGADGWKPRVRLDATINATGTEIGPLLSPDGTAFAFSRDAGDGRSGEFYLARSGDAPAWPRCAATAAHR